MTRPDTRHVFKARVYVWPGEMAAWRFLPMPKKESAVIKKDYARFARGFGSLPVTATINKVTWETSIFYDSRSESYLLPLKAAVRKKAGIADDDTVTCQLKIRT
ncbi:DUF1905 domain-containing protein [Candidatus Kaiserbacteria bacterium]|nr:DUF1905 domain-containing protein [Candidatus Kaiserbacteria bacterium]